jgi:hypothetical protein
MTKTIRLTKERRQIILDYGMKHIADSIDRSPQQKQLAIIIKEANTAIRTKYPESDMATLRKYNLHRIDRCLKFSFPSGRVDGYYFQADDAIADIPYKAGCHYSTNDVFPVSEAFEKAFDEHARLKGEFDKQHDQKRSEFTAFLNACQSVEDVLEVISLPDDLRRRIGHLSAALVAVTPETVKSLKDTFKKVA